MNGLQLLLRDNSNNIKKNTEALTDASKEVGLEVNTEKTTSICRYLATRVKGKKDPLKTRERE
jgi:hypothetical protein